MHKLVLKDEKGVPHSYTPQEWAGIGAQIFAQPPNCSAAHSEIVRPEAFFKDGMPRVRYGDCPACVLILGSAKSESEPRPCALGPHAHPHPIRAGMRLWEASGELSGSRGRGAQAVTALASKPMWSVS